MMLAAIALQAIVAAPVFAPPTDAPLRITTERTESAPERQYRLERLVRFSPSAEGYRAEAVVLGSGSEAPPALGNLVERGFSALTGRVIVFHLDSAGRVTAIDGLAGLWEQVCQGIADAAATRQSLAPGEAAKLADRIAAPLRALPAERQRALLATLVTAAILSEPLDPIGTVVPVKLPGSSPFGAPVMLDGTRRTLAAGNGLVRTATVAGTSAAAPAPDGAPAASVALERVRTADPRTGLIVAGLDTVRNRSGARQTVLVTRLEVARAAPSDWP